MMIRSGGGEAVKGAGIGVEVGRIAVRVNVGEAEINVAVGVAMEGLHAQTLSNRIVDTSRLDLLNSLTLLPIPLTLGFGSVPASLLALTGQFLQYFQCLLFASIAILAAGAHARGTAIRTGTFAHEFKRPGHQLSMHLE